VEEATGLVFGAILTVNSLEKMRKKEEKLEAFLKFLSSECKVQTEKKRV